MPSSDRAARPPAHGWARWRRAFDGFNDNHQAIHAGHIAFVALLSLFPFLIVLVAIAGSIGSTDAAREFLDAAMEQMPDDVAAALGPVANDIVNAPRGGVLTLGLLGALWATSTGFEALRYAFNQAYGIRQPSQIWWRRLQSIALGLMFALAVRLTSFTLVVIPRTIQVAGAVLDQPGLAAFSPPWFGPLVGLAVMVLMTGALFKILPRAKLAWRDVLPGAVLAVLGWVAAAQGFNLYLTHVASYSVTYGSLGGVVATLMFFYVAAAVLLFGCELNAAGHEQRT